MPALEIKPRWNDHTIFWWEEARHFNWVNFFLLLVVIFCLFKAHKAHLRDTWRGEEFKGYLRSLKNVVDWTDRKSVV